MSCDIGGILEERISFALRAFPFEGSRSIVRFYYAFDEKIGYFLTPSQGTTNGSENIGMVSGSFLHNFEVFHDDSFTER